jgi:hypothetical protein
VIVAGEPLIFVIVIGTLFDTGVSSLKPTAPGLTVTTFAPELIISAITPAPG